MDGTDPRPPATKRAGRRARLGLSSGRLAVAVALTGALVAASCSSSPDDVAPARTLTREELLAPETCQTCHAEHYREWARSMHAYAGTDPVFHAMNRRMVRQLGPGSADFCIKCHAPMAVRLGLTKDGLDVGDAPPWALGVTCVFCHTVDAVQGTHSAQLTIAADGVLRGAIRDPSPRSPHGSSYSPLHDRERRDSASLCGTCHDIVTPSGVKIERTHEEWLGSLYSKPGGLTCGQCHMPARQAPAADMDGMPVRTVHDHAMPGVDVALTAFNDVPTARAEVQALLDHTLIAKLCVKPAGGGAAAEVTLDNAFAGHAFPSGAVQDRRAWVELRAFRRGTEVFRSGVVRDSEAVAALADPNLWLMTEKIFDAQGKATHDFWLTARYESELLPAAKTNDPRSPDFIHSVTRTYLIPGAPPDRVTMKVRIRPIDHDVLDHLAEAGELSRDHGLPIPTFDLASTVKEWTDSSGFGCTP